MGLVLPLALLTSLRLAMHHPGQGAGPGAGAGPGHHLSPAQLRELGFGDATDTRATIQQRADPDQFDMRHLLKVLSGNHVLLTSSGEDYDNMDHLSAVDGVQSVPMRRHYISKKDDGSGGGDYFYGRRHYISKRSVPATPDWLYARRHYINRRTSGVVVPAEDYYYVTGRRHYISKKRSSSATAPGWSVDYADRPYLRHYISKKGYNDQEDRFDDAEEEQDANVEGGVAAML